MYSVRCVIDGKVYTSDQFQAMTELEREQYKGSLECDSCKGKAYFRKKRKDGRSACFCAKHLEGCDEKSKPVEVETPDDLEEENILYAREDQFTLKEKNYLKSIWTENEDSNFDPDEENFKSKGKQTKVYTQNPAKSITIHKTLPQLLTICINGITSQHNFEIEVYDNRYDHIRNCVHELKYVNESLVGKRGYYWSYIVCAEQNWLNTNISYTKNPSFLLSDDIVQEFWDAVKIQPNQWNKAVPIIVKGKLTKSGKGKFYVEISDFESLYVHTRKFKNAFENVVAENSIAIGII